MFLVCGHKFGSCQLRWRPASIGFKLNFQEYLDTNFTNSQQRICWVSISGAGDWW
jgi:hypothetical protein